LIVQQLDNHFISPTVLRATVRIHPAAIVLGLIAAASIGGIWGVLLAVPVMASVKIIVGHYWRTRVLGESWDEAREALIDDDPEPDTFITRLLDGDDTPPES
jgi:predicted PurR-regulated permease PerM